MFPEYISKIIVLFVGLLDYFLKKFEFTLDILPDLRTNCMLRTADKKEKYWEFKHDVLA